MPTEPTAYAQHLYATLHEMDTLGMDVIIAELPPAEEVWRAARDRLTRAAASRG
jgi:L-threonylcarbamoyladenylate synthase